MSYFEFDDARRLHQPYEDAYYRGKLFALKPAGLSEFACSSELLAPCALQLSLPELEKRNVLPVNKHVRSRVPAPPPLARAHIEPVLRMAKNPVRVQHFL